CFVITTLFDQPNDFGLWYNDLNSGEMHLVGWITGEDQVPQVQIGGDRIYYFSRHRQARQFSDLYVAQISTLTPTRLITGLAQPNRILAAGTNGSGYFSAAGKNSVGQYLGVSDGSVAGTGLLANSETFDYQAKPSPQRFAEMGGSMYFVGTNDTEIWKSNG